MRFCLHLVGWIAPYSDHNADLSISHAHIPPPSIRIHKHRRQITDPPPSSTRSLPRSPRLRTSSLTASIQTKTSVRPHQIKLSRTRQGSNPLPPPQPLLRGPMPPTAPLPSPTGAGRVAAPLQPPAESEPSTASPALFVAPSTALETAPTGASLDHTASSLLTNSVIQGTGGGGGPTTTTTTGSVMTDVAVIAAAAAEEGHGSGDDEEGEEVWGHSPSSSVCGMEEDDAVELTPEELGPLPTYDKGDIIAAMAAEEEADSLEDEEEEQSQGGDEEQGRARPPVLLLGRRGNGTGGSPPLSPRGNRQVL